MLIVFLQYINIATDNKKVLCVTIYLVLGTHIIDHFLYTDHVNITLAKARKA